MWVKVNPIRIFFHFQIKRMFSLVRTEHFFLPKNEKKIRDFLKVFKIQVLYVSKIQRVKNANGKKYIWKHELNLV